jgi:hypothetical protein
MKHLPAVTIVLLWGSLTGSAQNFGLGGPQRVVLEAAPTSSGCPIGMRVEQGAGGQVLQADDAQSRGIAQQFRLIMSSLNSVDIVGAQVTAHGFAAKPRYLPAQDAQPGSPDLTKTIDLKPTIKSKGNAYSDVRLPSFTAVSLIDLDSVTYADGSTWHSSAGKTCHVVPGLMLISRR